MTNDVLAQTSVRNLFALLDSVSKLKNVDVDRKWIKISHTLGSRLPQGVLITIQNIGRIDLILRSLEKEYRTAQPDTHYDLSMQFSLSESWIGSAYEIFRIAKNKFRDDEKVKKIHDLLRLLRVPIEKYELPLDYKLKEPLKMAPLNGGGDAVSLYDKNDPNKSYIIPRGISRRGSAQWIAIDIGQKNEYWIDRLYLSDEILTYGETLNLKRK